MYFDDLRCGMTVSIAPAVIEKGEMVTFATRFADQPLHTDEAFAKTTPFGQLLAPGMLSFLVVWSNYLKVDLFAEQLLAGKSTKVEWAKPVFAGDVLTAVAEITALIPRNPKNGIAELTLTARNQHDDIVLVAVVEAIVKRRVE